MRTFSVCLILISFFIHGCELIPNGIKGNGKVVKKVVNITSFDALEVSKGFNVYLSEGDAPELILEVDENLLPHIKPGLKMDS